MMDPASGFASPLLDSLDMGDRCGDDKKIGVRMMESHPRQRGSGESGQDDQWRATTCLDSI